jgi:hypothetical protein
MLRNGEIQAAAELRAPAGSRCSPATAERCVRARIA